MITIAIPTFNRPHLVTEAIDSAINQKTDEKYEIIVVDNCSSLDFYEKIVERYASQGVKFYRNKNNIGMYGNWNKCIEYAKGEYVTILNDDDLLCEDFISQVSKVVKERSELIICKSDVVLFNSLHDNTGRGGYSGKLKKNISVKKLSFRKIYKGNPANGSAGVVYKTELAKKLKGYDVDYRMSADYEFYVRYYLKYGALVINTKLAKYRVHGENETFKDGVIESYILDSYLVRNKICEQLMQKNRMYFSIFVNDFHRLVQCLRYAQIYPDKKENIEKLFPSAYLLQKIRILPIILLRCILYFLVTILYLDIQGSKTNFIFKSIADNFKKIEK